MVTRAGNSAGPSINTVAYLAGTVYGLFRSTLRWLPRPVLNFRYPGFFTAAQRKPIWTESTGLNVSWIQ